jgi:hypothetical protein
MGQAKDAAMAPKCHRIPATRLAHARGGVRNILGSKRVIKKLLMFEGRALSLFVLGFLCPGVPSNGEICTVKKPSKTAAELEASIKVEDICDWPTDMMISVQPDGDSWKVAVMQEGSVDDADRCRMIEQIATRLKAEYDLKG